MTTDSTEQVTISRAAYDHFRVQISMLKDDLHQALEENKRLQSVTGQAQPVAIVHSVGASYGSGTNDTTVILTRGADTKKLMRGAELYVVNPESDPATEFLYEVGKELQRAREKFPGDNITGLALAEEFGELIKAMLDEPADRVRKEAVQTAAMAARLALDGDGYIAQWRQERGLDSLTAEKQSAHDCHQSSTSGTENPTHIEPKKILHLMTQDGQPYGSERRCCEECGIMLVNRDDQFWQEHVWTDSREEYASDHQFITCKEGEAGSFYSPCRCAHFGHRVSSFCWPGKEGTVQFSQTTCKHCGRHDPKREAVDR